MIFQGGGRRREEENKIKRFTLMWLWWPEQRQSQWKWGLGRRLSRAWNHETLNTFIICLYVVVAHPPASTWNLNWTFISFCPLIDDSYRINGVSRTFSYFLAFLIVPHNLILNIKFQISFNCLPFFWKSVYQFKESHCIDILWWERPLLINKALYRSLLLIVIFRECRSKSILPKGSQ